MLTPGTQAMRVAQKIVEARRQKLAAQKQRRTPAQSNRASSLGHPCARHLFYMRTDAVEQLPETPDTLQSIFCEGDLHEQDVLRQLTEMGLRVYGTQSSFPSNSYQVTGHVDVRLAVADSTPLVIEVKSLNQTNFDQIEAVNGIGQWESVKNHSAQFIRGHYTQTIVYAFLADSENAMLLYKGKGTGEFKPVPLPLDLDHVQQCLDRAQKVNDCLAGQRLLDHVGAPLEMLPPFISDRSVCLRCPFARTVCRPPGMDQNAGGLFVFEDELAEDACRTILADGPAASRHADAKKRLREIVAFLVDGKDRLLTIGDYFVSAKHTARGMLVDVDRLGAAGNGEEECPDKP